MRSTLRRSLVAVAALSLAAPLAGVGCAAPGEDDDVGETEAAHTAKDPVQGNSPFFWAPTDYTTFKRVAQAPPFRVGAPLPGDGLVTRRLQAWADRIHEEVGKDVKRRTGKELVAPRPVIVVVPAKDANAWVSGVPACLTGKADVSALGERREAREAKLAFVEHGEVKEAFSMFGGPPPECAKPDTWPDDPKQAIAHFNTLGSRCKLAVDGDVVRVSGEGCELKHASSRSPTTISKLTYYAASPYIHFTSAMIALAKDEHAIAGVVAHELGHYYRSHALGELVMGKYNHWYQQLAVPETRLPPPVSDSTAVESRFREAMPYPMPRVPGQTLGYPLTGFAIDELASALDEAGLCGEARASLGEWRWDFGLGASFVSAETQAKYLAYERALLTCADGVRITEAGGAGTLSRAKLDEAISRGVDRVDTSNLTGDTLGAVLRTLNTRALAVVARADAFLEELRARRLGRYTSEQEADDFSVEYFARAGVTPKVRVDAYLELMKAHAEDEPGRFEAANGGLSVAACEALYRADWKEPNTSEPVVVPLGNLHDPHHGGCYRLFNMTQEIRAHRLRKSRTAPPTTDATWEAIRAEAKRVTDGFRPAGPGGGGPFGPQHTPQGGGGSGGTIVDGF